MDEKAGSKIKTKGKKEGGGEGKNKQGNKSQHTSGDQSKIKSNLSKSYRLGAFEEASWSVDSSLPPELVSLTVGASNLPVESSAHEMNLRIP